MSSTPDIVGIGGTTSLGSSTEQALQLSLASAEAEGARVRLFGGTDVIGLPHYADGAVEDRKAPAHRSRRSVRPMA